MNYFAFALLPPNAVRPNAALAADLAEQLEWRHRTPPSVSVDGAEITVGFGPFTVYLERTDDDEVVVQSKKMAKLFAGGREDREAIARAAVRFELTTDVDPAGEHFDDYIFLLEALEQEGSIVFDTRAGAFM